VSGPEILHGGPSRLAERLHALGTQRVLVLCSPSRRFVDEVTAALGAFSPAVFAGAKVHVPAEVVEEALAAVGAADTLVALGGGSAIGLGKALRLRRPIRFAAVPTTYAGSEMTTIWGITRGSEKSTGRDPRVRPDLILYDGRMTAGLPLPLTVQSLMNALAHPVSALATDSLGGEDRSAALGAAAALVRAMDDLLLAPTDLAARGVATAAASAAAQALDRGKGGAQHAAAHLLGGALGLEHSALHSILLPQFVAHLRERQAALVDELERAIGVAGLEPHLHDLLTRAGAPTSLDALGVDPAATRALLEGRGDLPAEMILDAQHGLRPTGARLALGPPPTAVLAGPPPERARRIVVALHGRGAEAGGVVRRFQEIAGHDPEIAIVGLTSGSNRWYQVPFGELGAVTDPEVRAALDRIGAALAALPATPTILAGFSQGACLALEYAARRGRGLAAVVAPCGARLGTRSEWGPDRLDGLPVLMGAAAQDRWVGGGRLEATAEWFRHAGAAVEVLGTSGDRHVVPGRFPLRAREIIQGRRAPVGAGGLGNTLESEAVAGALPVHQNSPRLPPLGLYAEQLSGSGFTARRGDNQRLWCYRIRPSSQRRPFTPLEHPRFRADFEGRAPAVDLGGWAPLPPPDEPRDFLDGLHTLAGAGSPTLRRGCAVHLYAANRDMDRRAFYDADGDLLIIPEQGGLTLLTEVGPLEVAPGQIAMIPRGVVFSVLLGDAFARGYVGEAFGHRFQLPERGPIGANGLADARHFRAPAAWFEDRLVPDFRIVAKLGGRLHQASQDHSPFDVVAWHGNHVPFRYDLADFSPLGAARFDHPDPSIHTVLTAPLDEPGFHTLDLIVFAPRWEVSTGTFRPPYFHRNPVSEVNGIVREAAAPGSPFQPGCCFLTPALTPHGPSGRAVERARAMTDAEADRPAPPPPGAGLWFQLESALPLSLTPWAESQRLPDWAATWGSHRSHFLHPVAVR
jgi:homogentisate 1,2-dioxygenase